MTVAQLNELLASFHPMRCWRFGRYLGSMLTLDLRCNWTVYARCLMRKRRHLMLQMQDANLLLGMRQHNVFNTLGFHSGRWPSRHIFSGRFKAVLVKKERHLLKLAVAVLLNSVLSGLLADSGALLWSLHLGMLGQVPAPPRLAFLSLSACFGRSGMASRAALAGHVSAGVGLHSIWAQPSRSGR